MIRVWDEFHNAWLLEYIINNYKDKELIVDGRKIDGVFLNKNGEWQAISDSDFVEGRLVSYLPYRFDDKRLEGIIEND